VIVNARMYSATPQAKAAWKRVLGWALARARLEWEIADYDAPAPLSDLWARGDLGAVMMCGLPYSQRRPRPCLVAAPVPSPARYGGRPIYFTDIAVRADSKYSEVEDTFGAVVGYTAEDSMSGYVALRRHLLPFRNKNKPQLYRAAVGGLVNARRIIEALDERRIDVGPLDSYYYDLIRHHEPDFAAKVRVVASTPPAPIPPLVSTSGEKVAQLREALLAAADAPELAGERTVLLLKGFAAAEEADYRVFDTYLSEARQYPDLW
jgi:ABC-type phosphate/phosphonate transport system substrate-binding protein